MKTKKAVAILGTIATAGLSAMPLGTIHAATSANVDITFTVGSTISITADASTVAPSTNFTPGSVDTAAATTKLTVITNNASGYKITVKDATEGGDGSLKKDSTNKIPSTTNETAPAAGTNAWGIKVGDKWFGIPGYSASAAEIFSSANPTDAAGVETTVTYGVSTNSALPSGAYSGRIIYAAVVNS